MNILKNKIITALFINFVFSLSCMEKKFNTSEDLEVALGIFKILKTKQPNEKAIKKQNKEQDDIFITH